MWQVRAGGKIDCLNEDRGSRISLLRRLGDRLSYRWKYTNWKICSKLYSAQCTLTMENGTRWESFKRRLSFWLIRRFFLRPVTAVRRPRCSWQVSHSWSRRITSSKSLKDRMKVTFVKGRSKKWEKCDSYIKSIFRVGTGHQSDVSEIKTDELNIKLQPSISDTPRTSSRSTSGSTSRPSLITQTFSQSSDTSSSQTPRSTTSSASDYTEEEENRDLDPWGMGDLSFVNF